MISSLLLVLFSLGKLDHRTKSAWVALFARDRDFCGVNQFFSPISCRSLPPFTPHMQVWPIWPYVNWIDVKFCVDCKYISKFDHIPIVHPWDCDESWWNVFVYISVNIGRRASRVGASCLSQRVDAESGAQMLINTLRHFA